MYNSKHLLANSEPSDKNTNDLVMMPRNLQIAFSKIKGAILLSVVNEFLLKSNKLFCFK